MAAGSRSSSLNSFNTDEETKKVIRKYLGLQVDMYTFNQSRCPRINKESLMPIPRTCAEDDNLEGWYPPGHGGLLSVVLQLWSAGLVHQSGQGIRLREQHRQSGCYSQPQHPQLPARRSARGSVPLPDGSHRQDQS
nr:UTP--glucose-1-phosphate uridylyltransferase-like [Cherax quadricarinatus]